LFGLENQSFIKRKFRILEEKNIQQEKSIFFGYKNRLFKDKKPRFINGLVTGHLLNI